MYDPFVKHNEGAIHQIEKHERGSVNIPLFIDQKLMQNTASNTNNGFFLFGEGANSRFDFNSKPKVIEDSYSITPPPYLKIVERKPKKQKKKNKKRKVKRDHILMNDLIII